MTRRQTVGPPGAAEYTALQRTQRSRGDCITGGPDHDTGCEKPVMRGSKRNRWRYSFTTLRPPDSFRVTFFDVLSLKNYAEILHRPEVEQYANSMAETAEVWPPGQNRPRAGCPTETVFPVSEDRRLGVTGHPTPPRAVKSFAKEKHCLRSATVCGSGSRLTR